MRLLPILLILGLAPAAAAQAVIELDLSSAKQILTNHKMIGAFDLLTGMANNYRQTTAVKVKSNQRDEELALLAQALRTDFDGSGTSYIPELTIWSVRGNTGGRIFLAASLTDDQAVLLATRLTHMVGMLAYEIKYDLLQGNSSPKAAQDRASSLGVIMELEEEGDQRTVTFFGQTEASSPSDADSRVAGKITIIEPPEYMWK